MASIFNFVQEVAALKIDGVIRKYTYPPNSLVTADLPASFVMPPSNNYEIVSTCDADNDTFSIDLVIATEAVGQNTQSPNMDLIITTMDNANAALKGITLSEMLPPEWTLAPQSTTPIVLSGTKYWGITATITAQSGG